MNSRRIRTKLALGAVLGLAVAGTALAAATGTGPSTNTDPYLLPQAKGVEVTSLLTVSDAGAASNGYEMVGIPDGLGAADGPAGRDFTLFMNHELRADQGVPRRHGQNGAFASQLEIDPRTLEVEEGQDLVDPGVRYWNYATSQYGPDPSPGQLAQFARWCSSYLSEPGQLFNEKTRRGYDGQIYFGNEENGDEGRAFGVTTDGQAQQLPRLGLFSWENTLVGLNRGDVTYVHGQEDTASGQLRVYIGRKLKKGNEFARAGLTNGQSFALDLENEAVSTDAQFRSTYGKNNPAHFDLGPDEEIDWRQNGAAQNAEAAAKGLTLNRIEDGAFDPRNPEDFYFVTTEGGQGATPGPTGRDGGGLWRLTYDDVERPWEGGTLTLLLDGSEPPLLNKPDNLALDRKGHLLIQEDPGNNVQLARIVAYDVDTGERGVIAEFDPARFSSGQPEFITQDEESSGIIDASRFLGKGAFLLDAQVHKPNPEADKVEFGQLMALRVKSWKEVFDG
jgi:Bacterial protein of unknown function (DUF839)